MTVKEYIKKHPKSILSRGAHMPRGTEGWIFAVYKK